MAVWARKVVKDPNATTPADVQALRDTGLTDGQIFAITAFVALRLAFSTVNDALGAGPDPQLVATLPEAVVQTVTYGRTTVPPAPE
jgi:alkylhydroperoxidase family enzyme